MIVALLQICLSMCDLFVTTRHYRVKNLLIALDTLYLKDQTLLAHEELETFEKFMRLHM